jgi:hypothetical protein
MSSQPIPSLPVPNGRRKICALLSPTGQAQTEGAWPAARQDRARRQIPTLLNKAKLPVINWTVGLNSKSAGATDSALSPLTNQLTNNSNEKR